MTKGARDDKEVIKYQVLVAPPRSAYFVLHFFRTPESLFSYRLKLIEPQGI